MCRPVWGGRDLGTAVISGSSSTALCRQLMPAGWRPTLLARQWRNSGQSTRHLSQASSAVSHRAMLAPHQGLPMIATGAGAHPTHCSRAVRATHPQPQRPSASRAHQHLALAGVLAGVSYGASKKAGMYCRVKEIAWRSVYTTRLNGSRAAHQVLGLISSWTHPFLRSANVRAACPCGQSYRSTGNSVLPPTLPAIGGNCPQMLLSV